MAHKTISVVVPVTLQVLVVDNGAVPLEQVGQTLVKFIDEAYVHEMIAEQLHNTVEDVHRRLMIEGTDVKADRLRAVVTITDRAE